MSCTAGKGGRDTVIRNLQPAIVAQNKDILIPVYVAGADNLNDANQELGSSPSITLSINNVDRSSDAQRITVSIPQVNFQGSVTDQSIRRRRAKGSFSHGWLLGCNTI